MAWSRLRGRTAAAAALAGGAAAAACAHAGVNLPAYFSPGMPPDGGSRGCPSIPKPPASAPVRVWQQTTPPDASDTCHTFAFGPLSDASEQAVGAFSSSHWSGGLWPRVWARRGPRPKALGFADPSSNPVFPYIHTPSCKDPKGRVLATMYLGDDYSSVAKANAVTEAEILHMLGASPSTWRAPLVAQGFNLSTDIISYTALAANPDRYVRYLNGCHSHDHKSYVTIDKFILHDQPGWVYVSGQSTPPTGVVIDYEVNDFRTPAQGAMFLVQLASDIHRQSIGGKRPQVYLYTNPWKYKTLERGITGGMAADGFDFYHMDQIKSAFDFISLYLLTNFSCNVNAAFPVELANIAGVSGVVKPSQLVVTVDFYRCNERDLLNIFLLNATQHFGGYEIFPKNTTMGGRGVPLTGPNLYLWRLMYGTSPPPT